jgi:hypothetical protein
MKNFAIEYQTLTDDEVLRIAADRENLVDEARQAIDMEMHRRSLTANDMGQYQAHIEKTEMLLQVGNLPFLIPYGIGKKLFGKRARMIDPKGILEEFDTTLWVVIFWVPLIPVTTYRIRRRVSKLSLLDPWRSYKFEALSRRRLDWRMVLTTWAWFVFTIFFFVEALRFASRF